MSVADFWALTPAETLAVLDAATWCAQREQERLAWLAWHVAALNRAKKLPSLKRLLVGHKTVQLKGTELEQRRKEHEELVARMGKSGTD